MESNAKTCTKCHSELSPCGSVPRTCGAVTEKIKRYICKNGHRTLEERPKDVFQDWVKFLAVRLHDKNYKYRQIAEKIESYILEAGIEHQLGKSRYSYRTIHEWVSKGKKAFSSQEERFQQFCRSNPEFEELDDNTGMFKFNGRWLSDDKLKESKSFRDRQKAWIAENPVVKIIMRKHVRLRVKFFTPHWMLLCTWRALEDNPEQVKKISKTLNELFTKAFSEALEAPDSVRMKAVRKKLVSIIETIQKGFTPSLLDASPDCRSAYCDKLSKQLNEAVSSVYRVPIRPINLKDFHRIYQDIFTALEYGRNSGMFFKPIHHGKG
ncbi:MAG: hypothetical protein AB7P76_07045 [Candidatus Melainabacteria bacterium]